MHIGDLSIWATTTTLMATGLGYGLRVARQTPERPRTVAWFPLGGPIGAIEPPASGIIDESDPIQVILAEIRTADIGKKVLLKDQILADIGTKYGKSISQVILRWHIESSIIPIAKSKNRERLIENSRVFDFALTADGMATIDALDHNRRLGPEPDLYEDHVV
jgi:diketogulonate reductase-like aldo/keto reductase